MALSEKEIYEDVVKNYNVGNNEEKLKALVRKNIETLLEHGVVGMDKKESYYIKNKAVHEVRKIFESYFYEKKKQEAEEIDAEYGRRRDSDDFTRRRLAPPRDEQRYRPRDESPYGRKSQDFPERRISYISSPSARPLPYASPRERPRPPSPKERP